MNISNTNQRCVIKASLENSEEVRRFALETKEFSQLHSILSDLFLFTENFSIRYKDDQGDIVLISNEIELAEAITVCSNLIRIFIRKEGGLKILPHKEVKEVKEPITDSTSRTEIAVALMVEEKKPQLEAITVAASSSIPTPSEKMDKPAIPGEHFVGPYLKVRQTREQFLKAKQDLAAAKEQVCSLKKQLEEEMKDVKKLKEEKVKQREEEKKDAPKKLMGRFVKHVTIPDNAELAPSTAFVKTWRFRNEAERPWPVKTQLVFIGKSAEDRLADVASIDVGTLLPGQEKDICIPMKTPAKQGHYVSYWRLHNPTSDKKFGQRVWVMINVVCDSSSSSSGDEKDEQEVVKQYGAALRQLHEMGFVDFKRNVKYLIKSKGDVTQTVKKLIKKMGKK